MTATLVCTSAYGRTAGLRLRFRSAEFPELADFCLSVLSIAAVPVEIAEFDTDRLAGARQRVMLIYADSCVRLLWGDPVSQQPRVDCLGITRTVLNPHCYCRNKQMDFKEPV